MREGTFSSYIAALPRENFKLQFGVCFEVHRKLKTADFQLQNSS